VNYAASRRASQRAAELFEVMAVELGELTGIEALLLDVARFAARQLSSAGPQKGRFVMGLSSSVGPTVR